MKKNSLYSISELFILLLKYSKLCLKRTLEYKFDKTFTMIAIFCREMISVVVMFLILTRFVQIKGWDYNEMFFLYSFLFLSYSVFVFFFAGLRDFANMIYSGEFDRFLTRPLGLMYQIIAAKIDFSATLGHGIVGIILFVNTAFSVGIEWNARNILYYIIALISGAVIQASIFLFSACFSFWTIKTDNLRNMIFFNARRISGYPLSFYPGIIQKLIMYVIPFAFVNYFPAQYFLKKTEVSSYSSVYLYFSPFVAAIMFVLVYFFWKQGVKRYSSTGTSM
jgi:ABC-2 type transport system permease protein